MSLRNWVCRGAVPLINFRSSERKGVSWTSSGSIGRGADLPARGRDYDGDAVVAAIASAHAAIEIVDSRYRDFKGASALEKLADFQTNGGFVHGPAVADWRGLPLERLHVRLTIGD